MTIGQIATIVMQLLLVIVVIIAVFHEEDIAEWEQKIFYNIKRKFTIKRRK